MPAFKRYEDPFDKIVKGMCNVDLANFEIEQRPQPDNSTPS